MISVFEPNRKKVPQSYRSLLTQIGENRYLDMYPTGPLDGTGSSVGLGAIATHWFIRVALTGDTMTFSVLSVDRFTELTDQGKARLDFVVPPEAEDKGTCAILLTSETPELRQFIQHNSSDTELWNQVEEYRRIKKRR